VTNPFLNLTYEPALESLGNEFFDPVPAATFPEHKLRFRNDRLLPMLGLEPSHVKDDDFVETFGLFHGVRPFLALRYHGYQFGEYNPNLGDGRGFLYGQVRGINGELFDFGTKGSGQTPYSRGGDGRLTLKGGVREVLAAEALHRLGVNTSRCLSLVETGDSLWRGDEPSPTRASVMIRFSRSHIRFGTFERLHYHHQTEQIAQLLDHVIATYYPEVSGSSSDGSAHIAFFRALVERVAKLVAQWMAAGFCHGVLNTDNMSITGESFDYGPYGFVPTYDLNFIAAYFDYGGRYRFGNQPAVCRWNLERLQVALSSVIPSKAMAEALEDYERIYLGCYIELMAQRLGLSPTLGDRLDPELREKLVGQTLQCLAQSQWSYPDFFAQLRLNFSPSWRDNADLILENVDLLGADWSTWRSIYQLALKQLPPESLAEVPGILEQANPLTDLLRPRIETIWEAIAKDDDWQPFNELVHKLQTGG
jgi:uncharacterized protein YdiU (UPF0061 family)